MENYHLSKHTASWKESMINRLSNLINRNRSAAKILQVLCSNQYRNDKCLKTCSNPIPAISRQDVNYMNLNETEKQR